MDLRLTAYPAHDRPAPAMLILPGGGYSRVAVEHEGEPTARWLNGLGVHAAVLTYTTGPQAYPDPLREARSALAGLRNSNAGFDCLPDQVGVLGYSAGGHLAGLLATDSPEVSEIESMSFAGRPDVAVLCYPVTDLRAVVLDRIANRHISSAINLLGENPDPELAAELSPTTRITAPAEDGDLVPPMFIWHTSDDSGVPVWHSLQLMTALGVAGVPFEAHIFPHGAHGLSLAAETPGPDTWPDLCADWLLRQGWELDQGQVGVTPL